MQVYRDFWGEYLAKCFMIREAKMYICCFSTHPHHSDLNNINYDGNMNKYINCYIPFSYPSNKKARKKTALSSILHPPSYLHQISCLLWLHLALIQRSVTRNNELTPHGAAWKCRCRVVGFWWWKTRMVGEESGGVFFLLSCLVVYSK